MLNEEHKSIQQLSDDLLKKVVEVWRKEGKWDGADRNALFYGLEKDPILSILITAFAFQSTMIDESIKSFSEGLLDEFEDMIVPYHLTKPLPALAMMASGKIKGYDNVCTDDSVVFKIDKESLSSLTTFSFTPLLNTKLIDAKVVSVVKVSDTQWSVNLKINEDNFSFGGVAFYFDKMRFNDLKVTLDGAELPLIKPWDFDRMPVNSWFSARNVLCNKALLYGSNEQWADVWLKGNLNYYVVDWECDDIIRSNDIALVFEFSGIGDDFSFDANNLILNSFPVVNVMRKDFSLSLDAPIVKLANEPTDKETAPSLDSFFMNLTYDESRNDYDDFDRFIIRHFGCERFNLQELVNLGDRMIRLNKSDFFAFHTIPEFQNSERLRRLDYVIKDISNMLKLRQGNLPNSGVYAILKNKNYISKEEALTTLCALFTNGKAANGIGVYSKIQSPSFLSKKDTRLLTETSGGRDEIIDYEERKMLGRYYLQTNDRIVTRSDLKVFCRKTLLLENIPSNGIKSIDTPRIQENEKSQKVTIALDSNFIPSDFDLDALKLKMERLIETRSSGVVPVEISFKKE